MRNYHKQTIILFVSVLFCLTLSAQKVTMEEIKQQCTDLPLDKRVRISVSSFAVATPKASGQFGDELSQMLSNALQEVNCFNVLLSLKDSKEITDEQNFGKSGGVEASTAAATGKMKGAQVTVFGKITEYAEGQSSGGTMGLKIGGNKAHIGFIIQLVNTETREVITSKSVNVDGSSSGFKGVRLFGVNMAGSVLNKAVADACEKGVIQAVEFISASKDKMPLPQVTSLAKNVSNTGAATTITEINIKNVDYAKMKPLVELLALHGSIVEKSVSNGNGRVKLEHPMKLVLEDLIDGKLGSKFSITEFGNGKMTLSAK